MITFRTIQGLLCRIDEQKAMDPINKGQLVLLLNKKGRRLFENMPYRLRPYPPAIHPENICERPRFANESVYQGWEIERLKNVWIK